MRFRALNLAASVGGARRIDTEIGKTAHVTHLVIQEQLNRKVVDRMKEVSDEPSMA